MPLAERASRRVIFLFVLTDMIKQAKKATVTDKDKVNMEGFKVLHACKSI
jgi:hypothetical protein